ncbi:MAG: hypothetical protein ACJ79K_17425, partial [Gemmatimonadaceae bacterium]
MSLFRKSGQASPQRKPLGTCCSDMEHAMNHGLTKLLCVETNGVLYTAVGVAETPDGLGWFKQAVFFCPFCGVTLQTRPAGNKSRRSG